MRTKRAGTLPSRRGCGFPLAGSSILVSESWAGGGRLRCETAGEAGNQLGELLPCDYLTGFGKAEAVEVLTPGERNGEDDESLRARVLELAEPTPLSAAMSATTRKRSGRCRGSGASG